MDTEESGGFGNTQPGTGHQFGEFIFDGVVHKGISVSIRDNMSQIDPDYK